MSSSMMWCVGCKNCQRSGKSILAPAVPAGGKTPNRKSQNCILYISFDDDIQKVLDNFKPYYALENEFAIVDDATGEMVGFVLALDLWNLQSAVRVETRYQPGQSWSSYGSWIRGCPSS